MWLIDRTDEDGQSIGQFIFRSLEEAEDETHDPDDIVESEHLIASPAISKRFNIFSDGLLWDELTTVLWAEHHAPELDGVYWRDKDDPLVLSSPRGVIHQTRLPDITWTPEQESPHKKQEF